MRATRSNERTVMAAALPRRLFEAPSFDGQFFVSWKGRNCCWPSVKIDEEQLSRKNRRKSKKKKKRKWRKIGLTFFAREYIFVSHGDLRLFHPFYERIQLA